MNAEIDFWDIQKVIKEYAKVAYLFNDDIPFDKISYPKQIKLRRIASALGAFMHIDNQNINVIGIIDLVFGHVDNTELIQKSHISKENEELIFNLIDSYLIPVHIKPELTCVTLDIQTRKTLFNMLLRYRVESEYLKTTFSTIIEGSFAVGLAINLCSSIYNKPLCTCNEKIERLLALLLGETFTGRFTIKELQEHHDYPLATDEELLDWAIDNI